MGNARTAKESRRRLRVQLERAGFSEDEIMRLVEKKRAEQGRSAEPKLLPSVAHEDRCEATGKVKFTRQKSAEAAASHRRRFLSSMRNYACEKCGRWHIGHVAVRKPRVRR